MRSISAVEDAGMMVNVRVSDEPRTVGQGVNKRELTSRSAEEKAQFKRNKNVILWTVSILIIVLTMIIMLLLF